MDSKASSYRECDYGSLSLALDSFPKLYLPVRLVGLRAYLEVHCTCNLLSNCSYNPSISRVTAITGLIFRL